MSIMTYNGGSIVAMTGKNCVAIACDKRFGIQGTALADNFQKIFQVGPHMFVGLPGLGTDTQTVYQKIRFRQNLYELKENRKMSPKVLLSMISNMLYERRFGPYFVEPMVIGLDPETAEPIIGNMDLIGCVNIPSDFVVGGPSSDQLYGMCETLWEPNLEPDDLFETIAQALVNACERNAVSGWGAVVYIVEQDKVTVRHVKTRMD
uniref:Proteasome subunit beta n=1 Tax=Cacopsylla melanoneura TaxID=428564 RepID=A0A8D8VPT1_9HEMI